MTAKTNNLSITEQMLLDNYDGMTNGWDCISIINGEPVYWSYRTGDNGDGYNCICLRSDAGEITLEHDRYGRIELDAACADHPALQDIERDEAILAGNQLRQPKDQRTVTKRLRLTPDEAERIEQAARDAGVTLSQYIRSRIL